MLKPFAAALMCLFAAAAAKAESLRFFGSGTGDADRVKIRADSSSIPANIGAGDITIEFWIKSAVGDNAQPAITPGSSYNWITGNIIFDRDRYAQVAGHGVSLTGGAITFGVNVANGQRTWRAGPDLRDNRWHHVAIQRSATSGNVQIYVDGRLEESSTGPSGSIAYPNGGAPLPRCGPNDNQPCTNSDPFIVIGAEKHDVDPVEYPAFRGHFTELRLSTSLRYTGPSFAVPTVRFSESVPNTAALYHFDHGTAGSDCTTNTVIVDSMGGASNGICKFGGSGGPQWSADSPFTPNPGALRFSSATYSAPENGGTAAISVARTGGTLGAASIDVTHGGGTAMVGADFALPASTTLRWSDGEGGAKTVNVSIVDDAAPEANETVELALTNATGAAIGSPAQATLTLNDNDGGAGQVLQFSSAAASINEAAGSVVLTVARTGESSGSVTVNYATSNGTAVSGSDYVATSGTLTFADGETSKQITITVNDGSEVEADETFTVTLSSPSGAELGAASTMTVTIRNDDTAPAPPPPAASGGGGGGGSFGAFMIALALLLVGRGHRERAGA